MKKFCLSMAAIMLIGRAISIWEMMANGNVFDPTPVGDIVSFVALGLIPIAIFVDLVRPHGDHEKEEF